MPKIIENLREQILSETERQIIERGYANTTIRSVAAGCGIAVGTVYNYFGSKDMLVAAFMMKNWQECVKAVEEHGTANRRDYLEFIYNTLLAFENRHRALFSDKDAALIFIANITERHVMLRTQVADLIYPLTDNEFAAEFVAEAMLCWSLSNKDFTDIYPLLPQVVK